MCHQGRACPADQATARVSPLEDLDPLSLNSQVQRGLNLALPLRSPAQMPALLATVHSMHTTITDALDSLNYVHFARFLPTPDGSILWVITTFDGELEPYIRDFATVLAEPFTAILHFVRGAPPLPVDRYPEAFWRFVRDHNQDRKPWSAYPHSTVLNVRRSHHSH